MSLQNWREEQMERNSRRFAKRRNEAVALMSNTKWREVFTLIARYELLFHVKWLALEHQGADSLEWISLNQIKENGIADPGIGGPCLYQDILCLSVPKVWQYKAPNGDLVQTIKKTQNTEAFLAELKNLGEIPLSDSAESITITGYVHPTQSA